MQLIDYTTAQRKAWDEVAPIHKQAEFEKLIAAFKTPGFIWSS